MQVEDLLFTHIGTGINVYDTLTKVGNNYKLIAIINPNRTLTYKEVVDAKIGVAIALYASSENPKVQKPNGGFIFNSLDVIPI